MAYLAILWRNPPLLLYNNYPSFSSLSPLSSLLSPLSSLLSSNLNTRPLPPSLPALQRYTIDRELIQRPGNDKIDQI